MADSTFEPGHHSLMRDGLQARVWALLSAHADALLARWEAERMGGDVASAAEARRRAWVAVESVLLAHPDREFAVFHPDDITAAGSDDVTPLFPDGT